MNEKFYNILETYIPFFYEIRKWIQKQQMRWIKRKIRKRAYRKSSGSSNN